MTRHTPGPWNATSDSVQVGSSCFVVSTSDDNPLRPADARLIALAPEMFSALRCLVEGAATAEQFEQARLVLAKARGEG